MTDLRLYIRDVLNFPKPGITFKDVTPLLRDPEALRTAMRLLTDRVAVYKPDLVVGVESRGFIFGATVADRLGAGFAPARKPGKLCGAAWEWGEVCADPASRTVEPKPFTPEAGAYCFYVPETAYVEGRGYRASVVFENISGHVPTGTWPYEGKAGQTLPYFWGDDLKTARAYADRVNWRQLRVSRKRAHAIVSQSMGLSMKADLAGRAEP